MLNSPVHRESLMKFAEDALTMEEAEDIQYIQDFEDDEDTLSLWLITMVDGEEYWLIENNQPCAIYKKSGIYSEAKQVIELYETIKELPDQDEGKDRFSYGYEQ